MFVHVLYRVCFTYASRYRVADLRRENASSFSAENGREMGKVSLRFFLFSNFVYVSCNGQLGESACFFFHIVSLMWGIFEFWVFVKFSYVLNRIELSYFFQWMFINEYRLYNLVRQFNIIETIFFSTSR